jgi:glycosyltransferase involved in cell wall biosynthesis
VIAKPSGGIPSMIEDRRTGFLVNDAAAFVNVVTKLSLEPDLCAKIGAAAQRHIASEFTLHRFHERCATLYSEVEVRCAASAVAHHR